MSPIVEQGGCTTKDIEEFEAIKRRFNKKHKPDVKTEAKPHRKKPVQKHVKHGLMTLFGVGVATKFFWMDGLIIHEGIFEFIKLLVMKKH